MKLEGLVHLKVSLGPYFIFVVYLVRIVHVVNTTSGCFLVIGETGATGGNLHRHGVNMQTLQRKVPPHLGINPGSSCCEARALTAVPPCHPLALHVENPCVRRINIKDHSIRFCYVC